jgi:N-acetylmuramoyl-L-alanine amidase
LKTNMSVKQFWKKITSIILCCAFTGALVGCGSSASDETAQAATTAAQEQTTTSTDDKIVLLLDPGHDSTHAGAVGIDGVKEEDLTLQLAEYLKEDLEKYSNVEVYMTRETSDCPYPDAGGSVEDNRARCAYAEEIGADFMISLHFNSGDGDSSSNGSLILIQNTNYEPTFNTMGQELGNLFLEQLGELGFKNLGLQTKEMTDDVDPELQTYPDGSRSDYYAILHHAKLHHVPAVIVEHGFITNQEDFDRINGSANLQKLAEADEKAIVSYFGLTE